MEHVFLGSVVQPGAVVETSEGVRDGGVEGARGGRGAAALRRRRGGLGWAADARRGILFAADFLVRLPVVFLAVARAVGGSAAFGAVLEGHLGRALLTGGAGRHGDGGFWMLRAVLLEGRWEGRSDGGNEKGIGTGVKGCFFAFYSFFSLGSWAIGRHPSFSGANRQLRHLVSSFWKVVRSPMS